MRVLVTRAPDDAVPTAEALKERGHEPLVAPLFEIRYLGGPEPVLENVQAILATSANGLRALARRSRRRDVPVFAVGTRTTKCARANGFLQLVDAAGDAAALAALVRERLAPAGGALVHVAGTNASHELEQVLEAAGFDVRLSVLYETVPASNLPETAADALRARALDAALFFSPRSALTFVDCVRKANLAAECANLVACCISDKTSAALHSLSFKEIRTAACPDQESVLALLDGYSG